MNKGVVVLPTVIILGLIITGTVLANIFVVQLLNRSNFGIRLSAEAAAANEAAVADAHLRLLRGDLIVSKSCPGFSASPNYSLPDLGRVSTDVYACQVSCPLSTEICQYQIMAESRAFVFVTRDVIATLDVDPTTGSVKLSAVSYEN